MPLAADLIQLEELASNAGPSQIQNVFNIIISELSEYLELDPVTKNVEIHLASEEIYEQNNEEFILDSGVIRTSVNSALKIEIIDHYSHFLRLLLLREVYYCFIPFVARESITVKICINQIVENDLERMSLKNELREWHNLVRDTLVNKDFIAAQLDRLKKYFKTKTFGEHQTDTIQHFFSYIHENPMPKYNFEEFYDIIFEDYSFKTSRSLLNPEIIETLKILIKIFYDTKSYLSLTDYQTLFKNYKENGLIETDLSLRKFAENLQWINKCSAIAPSYDYSYSILGFYGIIATLKFNPLLEKGKIKKVMDKWPFYYLSKVSVNCFALELTVSFHVPKIYFQDFIDYFNKLAEDGYIIEKRLFCLSNKVEAINLNYYTDISNMEKIIDPHNIKYNRSYEIECSTDYPGVSNPLPLSIFNYTIIERVKSVSATGLTFDKRIETLNAIKEDVENEIRNQNIINEGFKHSLEKVINSPQLRHHFLEFIEKNREQGFLFSYSQLKQILDFLEVLEKILNCNPQISSIYQLQEFLNSDLGSELIEEHILLRDDKLRRIISRDFLPLYFQSKKAFRKELEKVETFYNVLDTCYNLKILEFDQIKKIIEKPHLVEEIYRIREKKYNSIFKPFSEYKITNEKIESTIETFLHHEPPLLKPELINTIITSIFVNYYPEIVLEDTPEVYDKINKLKSYFPRMYINRTIELITNRKLIRVLIYSVHIKEKSLLLSILYSRFRKSLTFYKRFFWGGVSRRVRYGVRDFYDFEKGGFYYSKDLFQQMLKFSQNIFGDKLSFPNYSIINNIKQLFWSEGKDMADLVDVEKSRIIRQDTHFNSKEMAALSGFIQNLEYILLDPVKFREAKGRDFYQRYIQSIKFIPAFQKFGFSQYCLYFRPFYYTSPDYKIDFKLLFINSFQNIKYPASIEPNPAIFGEYIFPFRKANKSYLNWLVKAKKNVSEYCLFFKKKVYDTVHFNRNLTKQGWNYSAIRFKSYMQDVLFKRNYEPELLSIREFDLSELSEENFYGPNTVEFKDLTQLYNFDIKSYLGTSKYSIIDKITDLLKKKLIFPYVSLKNLDLQEKISIILPDIKEGLNEKLLKIFSFFNVSRIYEIEGDFYIYGFEKERSFENGLLAELWFPKCEIDEFFNVFDLLFQYLGIKHYLILTDLVKGETLLKSVYGSLDLLKNYNPLLNLKWNDKDKIWMNHKLFTEKFEPIYPDLNYGDKNNTT